MNWSKTQADKNSRGRFDSTYVVKQKDPTGYEKAKKDYDEYLPLFDKYISGFETKTNRLAEARTKITLNCTARVSVTWNIDEHYFLGAYGSYQYSNYANKYDYTIKEHNTSGQGL